jgi:DNA-binding PadR family transcriptional regulator
MGAPASASRGRPVGGERRSCALYPALQRLEQRGWILGKWETTEHNRRGRYYRLAVSGRAALGHETASWRRYVGVLELVLSSEGAE